MPNQNLFIDFQDSQIQFFSYKIVFYWMLKWFKMIFFLYEGAKGFVQSSVLSLLKGTHLRVLQTHKIVLDWTHELEFFNVLFYLYNDKYWFCTTFFYFLQNKITLVFKTLYFSLVVTHPFRSVTEQLPKHLPLDRSKLLYMSV